MVGLQSLLITYNYTLILSRNLYFDNDTTYSGLLHNQKSQITCHNMKIRQCTDSSDICFISKSKTQEISKRVHHNMQCPAIFEQSWALRMANLHFFSGLFCLHSVPEPNLCGCAKILGLANEMCNFSIGQIYSRHPQSGKIVGCAYLICNL